jgi:zinc protease
VTRSLITAALAITISACASRQAPPPSASPVVPRVAPLRYQGPDPVASSLDAPFRVTGPAVAAEGPAPHPDIQTFHLANGLTVELIERHGFPMIVTRLVVDLADIDAQDVGAQQAGLMGSVLLSPRHTTGAAAGCGYACTLGAWGPSDDAAGIFARLGTLVTQEPVPRVELERTLATAQATVKVSWGAVSVSRVEASLLFGNTHRYGYAPMKRTLTLDDLVLLRTQALDPHKATLVVVGDITAADALKQARDHFESWTAGAYVAPSPPPPPPEPQGPRLVWISEPRTKQVYGAISVRGPAPGAADEDAFIVLAELLGGSPASAAYEHVRGDLGAAYQVGASFRWHADASVLRLGGTFDPGMAAVGLVGLLDTIRAVRDAEPSAEVVSRAKRIAVARWRRSLGTNEGLASNLVGATLMGRAPDSVLRFADRMEAVTGAQVRAAAQRYLAADVLRLIVMGPAANLGDLGTLRLGKVQEIDGHGRLVSAPAKAAP